MRYYTANRVKKKLESYFKWSIFLISVIPSVNKKAIYILSHNAHPYSILLKIMANICIDVSLNEHVCLLVESIM